MTSEGHWDGVRITVVGLTPAGFAAADNLLHLGATVTLLAEEPATGEDEERAKLLEVLGATVRLGPGSTADLPVGTDALVLGEESPLAEQAGEHGLPVWGEIDLAWQLRGDAAPPWLAVTGSRSGRVVRMVEAALVAGGLRPVAAGEGMLPLVEAVMDPTPYDVLVADLKAEQLRHAGGMAAHSAVVLDAADPVQGPILGRVYEGVSHACVYNVDDPATEDLVREADVVEGARAIGFTRGTPGVGMVGLVDDVLADRAFIAERQSSAVELGTLADLADSDPAYLADVLAAAALARAFGVEVPAVRQALRNFSG